MSCGYDKVGSLVEYLTDGRIAGIVTKYEFPEEKFILDKMVSDGSRNAFVRRENEGKMWRFCNERLPEYTRQIGCVQVVIHPGFGGFSLQDENGETYATTDRHNPRLVAKAMTLIKPELGFHNEYKLVLIPSYMVNHYRIDEYEGAEDVVLLVDKYKTDEIVKIRKGFKNAASQLEEIDRILAMEIKML
jgi:hypothetical protein